jgi:CDP-glucose 4,6-dehydratase
MNFSGLSQLKSLPGPVLVTGHTGFNGTWLCLLLEELGIATAGLSLSPQPNSLYTRVELAGSMPEYFGDISDGEFVKEKFEEIRPSAVIHMAAQPLVLASYLNPVETFATNVLGSVNVINSSFSNSNVKVVGVITTDKVYRNYNKGEKFVESDPLEGKDPYSASKVGTESAVAAWQQLRKISQGPQVIAFRAGNVIGGGDFAEDRLIPDIVRARLNGKSIEVRGMQSSRPWQHVIEPLWGYLLALESALQGNEIASLNFGPNEKSLSVGEVVEIAREKWGLGVIDKSNYSNAEAKALDLDSTLASNLLGWKPQFSQRESITKTLDWWNAYLSKKVSARNLTKNEIQDYLSRVFLE